MGQIHKLRFLLNENFWLSYKKNYLCFVLSLGFSISAARLGLPDVGLISFGEMMDQGRQIIQAVSIPIIADGDNGYGNAMNVKRTIRDAIRAGYAGIFLEDQVDIIEKILIFITSSFVPTLSSSFSFIAQSALFLYTITLIKFVAA